MHTSNMTIWTIKSTITFIDSTCFEYTWEVLIRYANTWVSLTIFEQYVVFRLVLLDKLILYKKCIFFCFDYRI